MKKIMFFLCLTLVVQTVAFGQVELRPSVGITRSSLNDFTDVDIKSEVGFTFGLDVLIGRRVYLQPGLHYESNSNKLVPDAGGNSKLKVSKVRIPLLVGYKLFKPDADPFFNIRFFTGPSLSLVTSANDGDSPLGIEKDDFKSSVFGWNAGTGMDILIFFADINYQFGLSDVFEDLDIQGIEGQNSKNNLFYLSAGIRLKL